MDVARAGRQVRKQEVKRSPARLVNHLLQGADGHRTAPEQRVGGFDEKADRHEADIHRLGREDAVLVAFAHRLREVTLATEHLGLRRPVDVGVEHPDAVAHVAKREGEVGRDGRLAYAALARGDGDHMGNAARRRVELRLGTRRRAPLLDHHEHLVAGEGPAQQLFGLVLDLHREGIAALGKAQHDGNLAAGRCRVFDKTALDKVLPRLGVNDRGE